MDLLEMMCQRRSVRSFKNQPVEEEKLNRILDAGLLAPTSMNRRPCMFYAVKDPELKKQLSGIKKAGGAFLADAPAVIAVFADENKADTWIEDSSIALTFMMLEAESLGLSSCFVQVYLRKGEDGSDAEDNIRSLFNLPENNRVSGILALGYAEKKPAPYSLEQLDRSALKEI